MHIKGHSYFPNLKLKFNSDWGLNRLQNMTLSLYSKKSFLFVSNRLLMYRQTFPVGHCPAHPVSVHSRPD